MREECEQWHMSAVGPSVWTAAELRADQSWARQLTTVELGELRDTTLDAWARGQEPQQVTRTGFALPALGATIEHIHDQLNTGRGLFLLTGLNIQDYNLEQLVMLCSGLAVHLDGTLVPQNLADDLFSFVTDHSEAQLDEYQARGSRSRTEMSPHSDSSEIVGLLCVRSARRGGSTFVCSSAAVYNKILERNPAYLISLREGFHFDLTGKTETGVSQRRLPVFSYRDGQVTCQFNRSRILVGMRKAGVPLSLAETAALDCLSILAKHPDYAMHLELRPGDILLLNNSRILHARDAYEDWPEPDRKRLLVRFWFARQDGLRTEFR